MALMRPQVWQASYWEIEGHNGTDIIPTDVQDFDLEAHYRDDNPDEDQDVFLLAIAATFGDYMESRTLDHEGNLIVHAAQRHDGWLARLSAPGYTDGIETQNAFTTELEALEYLAETYFDAPLDEMDEEERSDLEAIEERIAELRGL